MSQDRALKGRPRLRLIAQVRTEEPNCWLCGQPIDLTLDAQRHPMGSSVDEIIPRGLGGSALDRANTHHAHRLCGQIRGVQTVTPEFRTHLHAELARRYTRTARTLSREW